MIAWPSLRGQGRGLRRSHALLMSDATAAFTNVEHNAALNSMAAVFVDVMNTDFVLGVIRQSAAR